MTTNIALRSAHKLLPLGTQIIFHHRAGIARWMELQKGGFGHSSIPNPSGWKLIDGYYRKELIPNVDVFADGHYRYLREMFFEFPQSKGRYPTRPVNKTVMVWPHDGFGTIMGIVRRSIGTSEKSYGSHEDYEQGYHDSLMYVDLYVIKQMYEGTEYILCPLWAVREIEHD